MKNKNILNTIGNTPLVKLNINGKNQANILAKLEFLNPGGSIKDRMAMYMIEMAEKKGILKPGMTIIEVTTGNTGVAFAMISAVMGYNFIAVMPEDMTIEKQKLMKAYRAKVILTAASKGPLGAIEKRDQLAKEIKNVWLPSQFDNPNNIAAHRKGIGQEIIKQTKGRVDAFVAGVGTGGTLMGIGEALEALNPNIKIIAVEPAESAILSGEKAGYHEIQGIGEGFIPKLVNLKIIDQIEKVSSREAKQMVRELALKEGILAGISSGANVVASLRIARKLGRGKTVVTVLPDRGERYLSQNIFN